MAVSCPDFSRKSSRCFVIAEAGVNHNGNFELAHKLIDAAADANADAVKFQAFEAEQIVTPEAQKAGYQKITTGAGEQLSMLKALELTGAQHGELKKHCEAKGLVYLCTPYDLNSLDALDRLGVDAYKIASTDLNNIPFLRSVASKRRPIILSTGMASLGEVEEAIDAIVDEHLPWVALLHCTSEYPAPVAESNLLAIKTLHETFGLPIGFSDHTDGITIAPLAVAFGAIILEKHFTLSKDMPGPDHAASLEPVDFQKMVHAIRVAELAFGNGIKRPTPSESRNRPLMRKSVVARVAVKAGEIIGPEHLTCKRPGDGLEPKWMEKIVGKRLAVDCEKDQQISLGSVVW